MQSKNLKLSYLRNELQICLRELKVTPSWIAFRHELQLLVALRLMIYTACAVLKECVSKPDWGIVMQGIDGEGLAVLFYLLKLTKGDIIKMQNKINK